MTHVCEMTLGTTIWTWLCSHCQAARKAAGWTVKRHKAVAFGCDQCTRDLERYRNAVSPPVDYVPTSHESFCPPPGWVAPAVPESWAARLAGEKVADAAAKYVDAATEESGQGIAFGAMREALVEAGR